jgi:ferredoxin
MSGLRYLDNVATLQLDAAKCIGCTLCVTVCPHGVLAMAGQRARLGDRDACIECGACSRNCPVNALAVKAGVGCASAIIHSWLTGGEPSCDCGGSC